MMEGRIKICEERGIEMIIQPRKPCEGLAERSSTSMKERMRAMIHQEDTVVRIFHSASVCSVCLTM